MAAESIARWVAARFAVGDGVIVLVGVEVDVRCLVGVAVGVLVRVDVGVSIGADVSVGVSCSSMSGTWLLKILKPIPASGAFAK